jgi:hypothetical protein
MLIKIRLTLLATAIAASSPMGQESFARDLSGKLEQCREQTKRTWPKGGDNLDRARDFMISNCINDGSPGPFHAY